MRQALRYVRQLDWTQFLWRTLFYVLLAAAYSLWAVLQIKYALWLTTF